MVGQSQRCEFAGKSLGHCSDAKKQPRAHVPWLSLRVQFAEQLIAFHLISVEWSIGDQATEAHANPNFSFASLMA
jgi:hypothetical protein